MQKAFFKLLGFILFVYLGSNISIIGCREKSTKEKKTGQEVDAIAIGHLNESALDRRLGGLDIFTRFVMWEIDSNTDPNLLEKAFAENYLGVYLHYSTLKNQSLIDMIKKYNSQLRIVVKLSFPPIGVKETQLFNQIEEIAQTLNLDQFPQGKILYLMLEAEPGEDSVTDWKEKIKNFADPLYGTGKILYLGLYATSNLKLIEFGPLLDAEKMGGITLPHSFVENKEHETLMRNWKNKGIGIISYNVHPAYKQIMKLPEPGYTLRASALRWSARHSLGIITLSPLTNKTDLDVVLASAKKKVTTLGQ